MSAVGVDIDDVLYGWFAAAHLASQKAGITNGVEPTSWAPYEDYGCTAEEWHEVLAAGALDGSMYADAPLQGAREALQALKDAGHTVHLVTARGLLTNGHLIREHTVRWLHEHQVPHDTLTFSKNKAIVRCDYFIDDNYDNIAAVTAPGGTMGFLVDRPWNAEVWTGNASWRVRDIKHAVELILYSEAHQPRYILGVDQ